MNWVRAIAAVLVLWSSTAWGATLTWTANSEPDLAGYRVYRCGQLPCTRASSNASLLVTLGTVTSFNIGTPAVTQYYFLTAYDFANNESTDSNIATFTPTVVPPPVVPPPVAPPPVVPPPVAPPPVVPPAIGASPTSFSFVATEGGANPATQTLSISNTGGGTLSWTASENTTWLTLNPTFRTGNGAVTLSVETGTLSVGSYSGAVTINATGASSVNVPVMFDVTTSGSTKKTPPSTPRGLRLGRIK